MMTRSPGKQMTRPSRWLAGLSAAALAVMLVPAAAHASAARPTAAGPTTATLSFPAGALRTGKDNVIALLVENTGSSVVGYNAALHVFAISIGEPYQSESPVNRRAQSAGWQRQSAGSAIGQASPGQGAGLTRRPAVQTPVTWPGSASTAMSASGSASRVITSAS